MGRILSYFGHGWAGSTARALDDVVVAFANHSGFPIAFGVPVALDPYGDGVVPFDPDRHTGADFVGVTVRAPSKAPDNYYEVTGSYGPDDLVDVLVRGHIVARVEDGDTILGAPVSIFKDTGSFAVGTGDDYIPLTNVRISVPLEPRTGLAELLLTTRNIL